MPVLRTSSIILRTFTTTLRSWLLNDGPSGLAILGEGIGIARKLEIDFPGRTFVVIPVGRLDPPHGVTRGVDPDFQKFVRALKTRAASGTGVPRSDCPSGISPLRSSLAAR
jgi:hypothetical protein